MSRERPAVAVQAVGETVFLNDGIFLMPPQGLGLWWFSWAFLARFGNRLCPRPRFLWMCGKARHLPPPADQRSRTRTTKDENDCQITLVLNK